MRWDENRQAPMTNQLAKQPIWLVLHGFNMIFMGAGSFAFHASYTWLGHFFDIAAIPAVLGFISCYCVATMFLEDLNRVAPTAKIGEAFSSLLSVISFISMLYLGVWFSSTRGTFARAIDGMLLLGAEVGVIALAPLLKLSKE